MIQQKITEIAEILGWSVDFSEPQNGKTDVNFAKYTSYGQDFNFSVELENDDMEAFIDNIHEYYENFDVDEEAYILDRLRRSRQKWRTLPHCRYSQRHGGSRSYDG